MPIYNYVCEGCGHNQEGIHKIGERHNAVQCLMCGAPCFLGVALAVVHTWTPLELELETDKPRTFGSKKELAKECGRLGKTMPAWDINI